ncbi:MAG: GGDEF domain-containing protein [Campylobacterota bacterium]|nr:GGDEF domain-containing protein [Campylobacterota bacterium]
MSGSQEILQIITNEIKRSIDQMDVVTPSMFASIFSKLATLHNITIEDEPGLAKNLLEKECSNIKDLQAQTTKSVNQLSKSTTKAMDAIKNKDEETLSEALSETEELKKEIEELRKTVYKDGLTNVNNRKWLHDNILESQKFKLSGVLAIIDLNYFKDINDTHGHIIGDKVLIYVAAQLKKTKGIVVRYGGDEFIIIFPKGTQKALVLKRLESIRNALVSKNLKIKGASFKISFSFGAQEFKNDDYLNNIIDTADKNMYRDKAQIKKTITGI